MTAFTLLLIVVLNGHVTSFSVDNIPTQSACDHLGRELVKETKAKKVDSSKYLCVPVAVTIA